MSVTPNTGAPDPGERLVAYVVLHEDATTTEAELQDYLRNRLPSYMMPSSVVRLAELPLNESGKVDRRALTEPGHVDARRDTAHPTPASSVEGRLVELWAEILRLDAGSVRPTDSFFDLGGHSLMAIRLSARVQTEFGVELPLRRLLDNSTPAALGRLVERRAGGARVSTIPRASRGAPLPCSPGQQRLWFLDRFAQDCPLYNMPIVLSLRGELSVTALRAATARVMARHEALRTRFTVIDGEPHQVIEPAAEPDFTFDDLSGLDETERSGVSSRTVQGEIRMLFDLETGPLVRFRLLRLSPHEHLFLICMHHVVGDGWSNEILLRELATFYEAELAGQPSSLPELPIQYADFAAWQRARFSDPELTRQLEYWREQLADAPKALNLPTDHQRPAMQSFRGAAEPFTVPARLVKALRTLCGEESATLFMGTLAVFNALLARYTSAREVVVGTPVSGRERPEVLQLIGFFTNTVALRTDLRGDPEFRELLRRVRETGLSAFANADVPFEHVIAGLAPDRDLSRSPLFQAMFIHQEGSLRELRKDGLTIEPVPTHPGTAKFDLLMSLEETGDEMFGFVEYSRDLFEPATVRRLVGHYLTLLESAVAHPDEPISALRMLTSDERRYLLKELNDTAIEFPSDRCVHQLLETQTARTPDAVALVYEDAELTYRELDDRAERLARRLRSCGVGPGSLVGICMTRSFELAIGLLGVLKAGGAYVPLDPAYPDDRLRFMLADSGASLLLTQSRLNVPVLESMQVVHIDADPPERSPTASVAVRPPSPDDLAYVIYTSGSTGRPKGVMVTHRSLCNFTVGICREPGYGPDDTVLSATTFCFDIFGAELFAPLSVGARVVIVSSEVAADGHALAAAVERHSVTVMQATPTTWRMLVHVGWPGRPDFRALNAGEAFPTDLAAVLLDLAGEVWNQYGPTETTVYSMIARVTPPLDRGVPIGRPMSNTRVYILDERMEPVPIGVPGQLHLGGVGVARGYLNRPELTRERFINDPFDAAPGAHLYRTGDLARYLPDGTIEYLGREDDQVKLHGFRIELGEIDAALADHHGVQQAVTVLGEDTRGESALVSYVVPVPPGPDLLEDAEEAVLRSWRHSWDRAFTEAPGPDTDSGRSRKRLEEVAALVLARRPRRILEIGCGGGALAERVAPGLDAYVGVDFSEPALDRFQLLADRLPDTVSCRLTAAHALDGVEGSFDMIVLDSAVAYFPSADYLERVLDQARVRLAPGGTIVITDVRPLPLLRAHHSRLESAQRGPLPDRGAFARRVEWAVERDRELWIDPGALTGMALRSGGVAWILPRPSADASARFRCDVVIEFDVDVPLDDTGPLQEWNAEEVDRGSLTALLSSGPYPALVIRDVPSAPNHDADPAGATPDRSNTPLWSVRDLRDSAARTGHVMTALWPRSGAVDRFDAWFQRAGSVRLPRDAAASAPSAPAVPDNDPLRHGVEEVLGTRLRNHLRNRLPAYMVPNLLVVMRSLPVTANGKIDRRALPAPDRMRPTMREPFVAPVDDHEWHLVGLWAEVLGVDRSLVGMNDHFFESGGHSLLAAQLATRVQEELQIELPLRAVFEHPTPAELNSVIGHLSAATDLTGGEV
ncbi:amino acid adenylation domain-containing protein [Streptosporangium sp. NPDC006013]|uniref:non-ribosomal peptide synthetase n=1 Tax=Streptosporangium sp. NPDC006013 TaxID=3155596 RepID=UPI0033A4FA55